MKFNKYIIFMFMLIFSFININRSNSQNEIRNLEPVNDGKRILTEQIDNYIIIQFNKTVTYEEGKDEKFLNDYNRYISYIINGNETIYPNSNFTAKNNTKLQVHFKKTTIKNLESFFNVWVMKILNI